jgi:hypothetical protein
MGVFHLKATRRPHGASAWSQCGRREEQRQFIAFLHQGKVGSLASPGQHRDGSGERTEAKLALAESVSELDEPIDGSPENGVDRTGGNTVAPFIDPERMHSVRRESSALHKRDHLVDLVDGLWPSMCGLLPP